MSYGLVYVITNLVNGKRYVGQTVTTLKKRWSRHCWECTKKTSRMPISYAIDKYGKENFRVGLLVTAKTQVELDEFEVHFVNALNTWSPHGYNLRAGKGSGVMSDITKKRIGDANRGRKATKEQRRRLSEAHLGWKMPEEQRLRLSKFMKGKKLPALAYINVAKALIKTYYFLNPKNKPITIVNMANFCRKHNLSPSKMSLVATGQRHHHKGYRLNKKRRRNNVSKRR
jgi:group I intron endonuclease